MVVLRACRGSRKTPVVLRQIFAPQIHVGRFVADDLLAPQFFHQPVLVGAVDPLDSPLGLRRTRRNQLDLQLLAHAPKLRERLYTTQPFLRRGYSLVQVLPVHVQCQGNSILLDPRTQSIRHRPNRFLFPQLRPRGVRRVIHHVDQATLWPALLQPGVKASIHLHQLAEMFLALATSPMPSSSPLATP
jgi:hypothetical protein